MASQKILDNIIQTIVKYYDPDRIVIFGSHAKGNNRPASDIDLAIIKDSVLPRYARGRAVTSRLCGYPVRIDLLFYTQQEFDDGLVDTYSFESSIHTTGKVLYEKVPPLPSNQYQKFD
jgi:predicted nucleotidyltransferase